MDQKTQDYKEKRLERMIEKYNRKSKDNQKAFKDKEYFGKQKLMKKVRAERVRKKRHNY